MRLILPGVNGSAYAREFRPPVSSGLVGWWWLGGTEAKTEKDHAYLANATLAGSPTIETSYVSFGGYNSGQWLQTEVAETNDFSWLVVARTSDALAASSTQPTIMSTWSSADPAYSSQTNGSLIYYNATSGLPQGTLVGGIGHVSAGTVTVDNGATLSIANAGEWAFLALTYNDTSNVKVLYNRSTGTSNTNTVATDRSPRSNLNLRIGGGFNTSFRGTCDVAFAAAYSSALTAQEVADTYAFVQTCLSDWHGLTI